MTHYLQKSWIDEGVEAEYLRQIQELVHTGSLDTAVDRIINDLEDIDAPLSDLCRELSLDSVEIGGWEEISDSIAQFEGDPVTAVHIIMSNEGDLIFEDKNIQHDPLLEVVFYTDEHIAFSALSRDELLTESLREEPEWFGQSEDIEVYLEINGLGQLNTALLRHKRQYFFRDSAHVLDAAQGWPSDLVPLPYIEYRLAAMLRAVRYHQAVKELIDGFGIHDNVPVIVGMHNMRLDIGSVYLPKTTKVVELIKAPKLAVVIKRNMEEDVADIAGSSLRQNLSEEPVKHPGFFARLFRRRVNA